MIKMLLCQFGKGQGVAFLLQVGYTSGATKILCLIYPKILFHRITEETLLIPINIVLSGSAMYQMGIFAGEVGHIFA